MELKQPTNLDYDLLVDYKAQFKSHVDGAAGLFKSEDILEWIRDTFLHSQGKNLSEGYVASTTYLAKDEQNNLIGIINIRHELNDFLFDVAGHIGYSVHPKYRGQGHATKMLSLALKECLKLNLKKVLVTCDKDNIASEKVIIKNGGVFENFSSNQITKRYWITL